MKLLVQSRLAFEPAKSWVVHERRYGQRIVSSQRPQLLWPRGSRRDDVQLQEG